MRRNQLPRKNRAKISFEVLQEGRYPQCMVKMTSKERDFKRIEPVRKHKNSENQKNINIKKSRTIGWGEIHTFK